MFERIGSKIKIVAMILWILGAIICIAFGVILLDRSGGKSIMGYFFVFGGPVITWIVALLIGAIGELVENIDTLADNSYKILALQRQCLAHSETSDHSGRREKQN